jgi:predicted RNA-binding Zn-ribbon protein involved in translation (DUF1610 family)
MHSKDDVLFPCPCCGLETIAELEATKFATFADGKTIRCSREILIIRAVQIMRRY